MNLSTGYPYSLITNGLPFVYPKLLHEEKTDVVIIGAGISGALAAYTLIRAGISCIVVDARSVGLGSTCASTSLLQYEIDKPLCELAKLIGIKNAVTAYRLCAEAIDLLEKITAHVSFSGFEKQQSLYFSASEKHTGIIESEYQCRKNAGFDVEFLSSAEIKKEYGFTAPNALLSAKGAVVDAYMLTHALLQKSIRLGLRVYDRTRIEKIQCHKRGVHLITQDKQNIKAKKIISATGYEVLNFMDKKIVKLNSTYAFASEHVTGEVGLLRHKTMLWNTADPYLYIRSTRENRIIVGGRDEPFYNPARRDKLIKRKSNWLLHDFKKLFPASNLVPEFNWTGTFGTTKDALPYIGTYANTPHTYYALGFGGNGIVFSVIAARLIRDSLMGKRPGYQHLFGFDR